MCILCVYHAVFHFVAYNKTFNKQPIFERRLTIGVLKPKRLCAYGSKGFRLWELSKSKIRNNKAIDSSQKKNI